jgi:phosphate transport system substrate-binding protein
MYSRSGLALEPHPCPPNPKRRFAKIKFLFRCSFPALAFFAILVSSRTVHADTLKIAGTGASIGALRTLAEAFKKFHPGTDVVFVYGLGSAGAREALQASAIHIAVTGKPGNLPENMPGATIVEYGKTPFVFATSKSNSVSGLTSEQILAIYNGTMSIWPNGKRLRLVLRPETDSDTDMLKSISPAMEHAVKAALQRDGMKFAITDQDSADAIESIPGAIGTSTLSLILSEKRPLKVLALNSFAPSVQTIGNGRYPHFKTFYLVARSPLPEDARQFILFVRSPAGREILTTLGHWIPEAEKGFPHTWKPATPD